MVYRQLITEVKGRYDILFVVMGLRVLPHTDDSTMKIL